MEPFDNNGFDTENNQTPSGNDFPETESFYHYSQEPQQKSKPESPYANSPYASYRQDFDFNSGYAPAPKEKRKKTVGKFWKKAASLLTVAALVAAGCLTTALSVNNTWENRTAVMTNQFNQQISSLQDQIRAVKKDREGSSAPIPGESMTPRQVYAQNVDSVVYISCTIQSNLYGRVTEGTASGSGFILTENGYIATNHHVIDGATSVKVITYSGEEYSATVVGSEATNDVAVLKVDAEDLPAVAIGSSEDLSIGDMVVAIGNPLGKLTATQTVGYVSGKNREVQTDNTSINMIQTDAAINSGNSGGPLFNMQGEVVGITTAKYSGTTTSGASIEGISFAIPIDDVLKIIEDLQTLGYVSGAYLGITVKDTDAESAAMFGLPTGAYVVTVNEGGSADNAGVQPKDIIIQLGDTSISNRSDLLRALRKYNPGDTTTITVVRGGQTLVLTITLDERPQESASADTTPAETPNNVPNSDNYDEWFEYFRRFFGQNG